MADKRCPMCGKSNPEDVAVCEHCGARVKPLIAPDQPASPPTGGESPAAPQDQSQDQPDWMTSLRDEDADVFAEEPAEAAADDDWLSGMRDEGGFGEDYSTEEDLSAEDDADGLPDWLTASAEDVDDGAASEDDEAYEDEGDDQDDWLGGLGVSGDGPSEFQHAQAAKPSAQDDLPDWLKFPHELGAEAPAAEEESDWKAGLGADQDETGGLVEFSGEDEIDWGEGLGAEAEEPPAPFEHAQAAAPGSGDVPDWMSGLGGGDESSGLSDLFAAEGEAEAEPDWMSGFGEDEPAEESDFGAPADQAETPDWMTDLGSDEPDEMPDFFASGTEDAAPDWMAGLGGEAPAETPDLGTPTGEAETADWMAELGGDEPAEMPDFLTSEAVEEEAPDWMADFGSEGADDLPDFQIPEAGELEAASPESLGDEPDWLDSFSALPAEPAAKSAPAASEDDKEWLSGIPESGADLGDSGGLAAADEPDWLDSFSALPAEPAAESAPAASEDDMDWLSGLSGSPTEEAAIPDAGGMEPEEGAPDWLESFETDLPGAAAEGDTGLDWLNDLGGEDGDAGDSGLDWLGSEVPDEAAPASYEVTSVEGDEPDWLAELGGADAAAGGAALAGAFETEAEMPEGLSESGDEFPDWLAEISESGEFPLGEDLTEEAEAWALDEDAVQIESLEGEPEPQGDLAPGELPGWLEAMRPEDDGNVIGPAEVGNVERAGPLAGLGSLLRPVPAAAKIAPPPTYSDLLDVTEPQRKYVDLLRSIVATESEPRPAASPAVLAPQRVLRWIIFVGLFLAVGLPLLAGENLTPLPGAAPEVQMFGNALNALPEGAPVLLVFDYEPAMSGEMDAAGAAVVNKLVSEKKARLAVVSTSPTGPALGEMAVARSAWNNPNYFRGQNFENLGYISGGIAGLQNFALTPKQTVLVAYNDNSLLDVVFAPQNSNPWMSPALSGVNQLFDFSMTIVLTDNPDTARSWVEQVGPDLRPGSLFMVISAQAEPLVRPYYEASNRQIGGMVTGLAGGAAFEGNQIRPNLARSYWDAFSMGIFMTMLLVLFGGFYTLVRGFSEPRQKSSRKTRS